MINRNLRFLSSKHVKQQLGSYEVDHLAVRSSRRCWQLINCSSFGLHSKLVKRNIPMLDSFIASARHDIMFARRFTERSSRASGEREDTRPRFPLFEMLINNAAAVIQSLHQIGNIETGETDRQRENERQTDMFYHHPSHATIIRQQYCSASRLDWNTTWKIARDPRKRKGWLRGEEKKTKKNLCRMNSRNYFFPLFSPPLSFPIYTWLLWDFLRRVQQTLVHR